MIARPATARIVGFALAASLALAVPANAQSTSGADPVPPSNDGDMTVGEMAARCFSVYVTLRSRLGDDAPAWVDENLGRSLRVLQDEEPVQANGQALIEAETELLKTELASDADGERFTEIAIACGDWLLGARGPGRDY